MSSRLDILKDMAAAHQGMFIALKERDLEDTDDFRNHVAVFNALSNAIGLINGIGRWRRYEVGQEWDSVSPCLRPLLGLHAGMVRRAAESRTTLDRESSRD